MITFYKEFSNSPCTACGHKEPGTRSVFEMGQVREECVELRLCSPCRKSLFWPVKVGFIKGQVVKVNSRAYDKSDRFKIVDFYEAADGTARVQDEEGAEHLVRISELESV